MDYERHTLHFEADTIAPPPAAFRSPNGSPRIYLLVHGFNNDENQAKVRYQAFRERVAQFIGDDAERIWELYWPGYENVISQPLRKHLLPALAQNLYTATNYHKQVPKAIRFGKILGRYLLQLRAQFHPTEVVLIGHSLGCRLILEAMAAMQSSRAERSRVPAILLMAGAVPVEHLRLSGNLDAAVRFPERRIALYSRRDTVLRWAFPEGQRLSGDGAYRAEALGLNGAPRECWTARDQTMLKHGEYWASKSTTPNVVRLFGKSMPHALPYTEIVPRTIASPSPLPEWRTTRRSVGG
jgi:predicted alpha/beta hydrolase family esterase